MFSNGVLRREVNAVQGFDVKTKLMRIIPEHDNKCLSYCHRTPVGRV